MQENVSILKVLACGAIGTASNARFIKVKVKVRILEEHVKFAVFSPQIF